MYIKANRIKKVLKRVQNIKMHKFQTNHQSIQYIQMPIYNAKNTLKYAAK